MHTVPTLGRIEVPPAAPKNALELYYPMQSQKYSDTDLTRHGRHRPRSHDRPHERDRQPRAPPRSLSDLIFPRVGVGGEEARGDVFVGEGFDAATGECAGGVSVNSEAEHHGGRVLGVTGAA